MVTWKIISVLIRLANLASYRLIEIFPPKWIDNIQKLFVLTKGLPCEAKTWQIEETCLIFEEALDNNPIIYQQSPPYHVIKFSVQLFFFLKTIIPNVSQQQFLFVEIFSTFENLKLFLMNYCALNKCLWIIYYFVLNFTNGTLR